MNYPLAGLAVFFVIVTIIITHCTLSLMYSKQYYYQTANNIQREQLALEKEKLALEKEKTNLAEKFLIKFLREKLNVSLSIPNDKNV